MRDFKAELREATACRFSLDWIGNRSPREAWEEYPRGDYLLCCAARIGVERRFVVDAACDCVETVFHYLPLGENRPQKTIAVLRRWVADLATADEVAEAGKAVYRLAGAYGGHNLVPASYVVDAVFHIADAVDPGDPDAFANIGRALTAVASADGRRAYIAAAAVYLNGPGHFWRRRSFISTATRVKICLADVCPAIDATHAKCADLVRKRIPWELVAEARDK